MGDLFEDVGAVFDKTTSDGDDATVHFEATIYDGEDGDLSGEGESSFPGEATFERYGRRKRRRRGSRSVRSPPDQTHRAFGVLRETATVVVVGSRSEGDDRPTASAVSGNAVGRRTDWSPGLLSRALVLNLGYNIGESICESKNGLEIAAFVACVAMLDEFFLEYAWIASKTFASTLRVHERIERVLVLIRYFAITALVSAFTELLKYAFYREGDVSSVVLLFVIIFVIADLSERVVSR